MPQTSVRLQRNFFNLILTYLWGFLGYQSASSEKFHDWSGYESLEVLVADELDRAGGGQAAKNKASWSLEVEYGSFSKQALWNPKTSHIF